MAEKKEKLFDMFPPVSTEEWMAKINVDLKGADFNKKLVWRTNEGFNVMPFYRKEDIEGLPSVGSMPGQYPYVRGTKTNNDWLIRQQILGTTAEEINANAKHAIDKGVESLGISMRGLEASDLAAVLEGIDLNKVEVNIICCPRKAEEMAKALVELVEKAG
ncbi:MAG: methylmalonyl-CoA mutase small subunit, partial [Muribaculaceae bacterium]|nr:methylmalonyl-CoA mutase small subunit [Muribaculaceae bacterium]